MIGKMDNLRTFPGNSPLRLYLTPGKSTTSKLLALMRRGKQPCQGIVMDAAQWTPQMAELAEVANDAGIETILDPRSLELASGAARLRPAIARLPWCTDQTHTPATMADFGFRRSITSEIARFASDHGLTGVLAPTHFVSDMEDAWWSIDDELVADLRRDLDDKNDHIVLYRPLFLHSSLLRRAAEFERIVRRLQTSPFDGIWLAVHPFGTASSGQLQLARYLVACQILHLLDAPIIGARTGTVGLLLMALGAVGGIESGITDGENFSFERRTQGPAEKREGKKVFGPTARVYVQGLGTFLTTKEAEAFFQRRGMAAQHACQAGCCPRGVSDMIGNRVDHFLTTRAMEVDKLSSAPPRLRGKAFLDDVVRPASDKAVAAARLDNRIETVRRRWEDWRILISDRLERSDGVVASTSPAPTGNRLRRRIGA